MKIIVVKGVARYDAVRHFSDELAAAFRALEREVVVVDVLEQKGKGLFSSALSTPCDFVVGYNGVGADLKYNGSNLYDAFGIPFVAPLVDHPMYVFERLTAPMVNLLPTCVDQTHQASIRSFFGLHRPAAYWPHAASFAEAPLPRGAVRDIDILFAGSFIDPVHLRDKIAQYPRDLSDALFEVAERIEDAALSSFEQLVSDVFRSRGFGLNPRVTRSLISPLTQLDGFIRARRRLACLQALDRAKVSVDIFGDGWDTAPPMPAHRYHGSLPYRELLNVTCRAKVSLHVHPLFMHGLHERILSPMANGAAVLSDASAEISANFIEGERIDLYHWSRLGELPDIARALVRDDDRRATMAHAASAHIAEHHTWDVRARSLLKLVENFRS